MKYSSLILILSLVTATLFAQDDFKSNTLKKINTNQKELNKESLFLHTNGSIFNSGDTIWFKAYNQNIKNLKASQLSHMLTVGLLNAENEIVLSQKHKMADGKSTGDIIVPDSVQPGQYYIVAYSDYSAFQDSESMITKEISIVEKDLNDAIIRISMKDSVYKSGDLVSGDLELVDIFKSLISKTKVELTFFQGDQRLSKEVITTNTDGKSPFSIQIPDLISETEMLILKARIIRSNYIGNSSIIIPCIETPPVITFLPEGGNLINGKTNKLAFKAADQSGIPFDFKGSIINEEGEIVQKVESFYKGTGSVELKGSDKAHYLVIDEPKGYTYKYEIPKAAQDKSSLQLISNDENKIQFKLLNNQSGTNQYHLFAQVRGIIYYAESLNISSADTINISSSELPIGIATFTLFDANETPLSERLVFVNKHRKLNITVSTNKNYYKRKERVIVNIQVKDKYMRPVPSNLSMDVSLHNFGSNFENESILSRMLLSSELKGYISTPEYYFSKDENADKALDLLLLSHGWRTFVLTDQLASDSDSESDLSTPVVVSGKVVDKKGLPVADATIAAVNYRNFFTINTTTDQNGVFRFSGKEFGSMADEERIVISATHPKKNKKVKTIIDPDYLNIVSGGLVLQDATVQNVFHLSDIALKESDEKEDGEFSKLFSKNDIWLNEVSVKSKRKVVISEERREQQYIEYAVKSEQLKYSAPVTSVSDIQHLIQKAGGNVQMAQGGKVMLRGYNSILAQNQTGAAFIVDGVFIGYSISELGDLDINNVKELKVIKSAKAGMMYSAYASGGVIEITTKNGFDLAEEFANKFNSEIKADENIAQVNGIKFARKFYSPTYNEANANKAIPDDRKTIHWEPNINIGRSGYKTIIFYNSDIDGEFKVSVHGVNKSGWLGSGSKSYFVNVIDR